MSAMVPLIAALVLTPTVEISVPIKNWIPTKLQKELDRYNLALWVAQGFPEKWPFLGDPLPTVTLVADDGKGSCGCLARP